MSRYEFVVDGTLGKEITSAFDGLTATTGSGQTVLTGVLTSTEAVRQVLNRLESFGIGLRSMRIVDVDDDDEPSGSPRTTPRDTGTTRSGKTP